MLKIDNFTISYRSELETRLYNHSCSFESARNLLIGETGIGKTTLLLGIAGLLPVLKGAIYFDNIRIDNMPANERPISIMFQEHNIIPYLTTYDNILLGFPSRKVPELLTVMNKLAIKFDLTEKLKLTAGELSGGQKQLIAIVRLLLRARFIKFKAFKRQLLILDEPLTGLDEKTKLIALDLILQEANTFDHLLLISLHEAKLLFKLNFDIWEIYSKQGNLFAIRKITLAE